MPSGDIVYREFTQSQLDWAYNNRDRVPDHGDLLEAYAEIGEEYVSAHDAHLDIAFGQADEELLDIYPAQNVEQPSPVLIYFHGGYWYSRHKDDFRFIAAGFTGAGITVVVVNYALIPSVDMAELVRQCQSSVAWVHTHVEAYGGDPNRLFVTGHSAGGHLTAMMFATEWSTFGVPATAIAGGIALSGLYDLEPVRLTNMNEILQFDTDTVRHFSPATLRPTVHAPLVCAVGGDESSEFVRHNNMLVQPWSKDGILTETIVTPGLNHFSILGDFAIQGGTLNDKARLLVNGHLD